MEYYTAIKMNDVDSVSDMQGCPWYITELNRQVMVPWLSHFSTSGKNTEAHTRKEKNLEESTRNLTVVTSENQKYRQGGNGGFHFLSILWFSTI